jgi:hypothetical protein
MPSSPPPSRTADIPGLQTARGGGPAKLTPAQVGELAALLDAAPAAWGWEARD